MVAREGGPPNGERGPWSVGPAEGRGASGALVADGAKGDGDRIEVRVGVLVGDDGAGAGAGADGAAPPSPGRRTGASLPVSSSPRTPPEVDGGRTVGAGADAALAVGACCSRNDRRDGGAPAPVPGGAGGGEDALGTPRPKAAGPAPGTGAEPPGAD
ncbi:hypothetical protein GCM10009718_21290 [Isoptericola halotolerans]|uniref:Uncharacterized protein n=1 Tax=Isoptericola halotolerans TaxID=300560 RepID=A0ABX2A7U5_9MICO|nr:hypothetical protein [Isoptericola halotolerans]NOV98937.1 hypothetical protein [Isoptericola halotolerans]